MVMGIANYRDDDDLEFLKNCSNEDLDILVTYLIRGEKGSELRLAEELTGKDSYKRHNPDHVKYWKDIAAELQTFGGNTFANMFRGGEGVLYKEVLTDACENLKVNFNNKASTQMIEMNLLNKILTDSIEKMDANQLKQLVDAIGIKTTNLTPQAVTVALQAAVQMSGFAAYKMTLIVANAVAKQILGRGLALGVNATLMKSLSIFAGPIGWVFAGLWAMFDIAGPAYRVTVPSVVQIAYMRAKLLTGNS